MPAIRFPTLEEVWDNPALILKLPLPLAREYLSFARQAAETVGGSRDIPPTPADMAIANPRYRWMDTRHIHYLSQEVTEACERPSGAIIVTMPPRHAKTHTCSVWTPFWFLANRPTEHVLLISYEQTFARKWGIKVRNLVELYGRDYGLRLDPKQTAGDDWALLSGGGMKCVGAGGGISGNPVKLLIADDLLKNDEEARSEVIREKLWDWWEGTVIQRIEPDTTTIVIGTRYHEDDIIGRLIQHSNAGDGLHFDEITLRAKAEIDDPLDRFPGEGLWCDHAGWSQDYYDAREAAVSPYVWSSVYQQRPSPPGGNKVDPSWFRYYRPHELPQFFDQEIQSWDLALDGTKKTDSFHCGMLGSRKGALVFLRDAYHEHGRIASGPDSAERTVISTIRNWNQIYPAAKQKLVERAISGNLLVQTLQHEVSGMLAWPPKGQQKGSKESCLEACVPDVRSGNVLLPLNPDGTKPKWVQEFTEELRQFPNAPHDDWVDAFSQLMGFLLPSVRRAVGSAHTEARRRVVVDSPQSAHTAGLHANLQRLTKKKMDVLRSIQRQQERSAIPYGRLPTGLLNGGGASPVSRRRGMW